jgi:hypothetical protein
MFVAPLMDGDTITGIVVESKAGREAILAQRVIDATGDADVALRAGAPTHTTPLEQMLRPRSCSTSPVSTRKPSWPACARIRRPTRTGAPENGP